MARHRVGALAALIASAALALSGCAGGETAGAKEASGGSGKMQIALISKGYQHQFWQAVRKGAEQKAEELGVDITFEGPAAEVEIDKQLQMLKTAIDKKPAAIGFAALDPEACIPTYEEAKAKGVPIIEFDTPCNSDYASSLAASDNYAAAALAAQHMADLIGGEGDIAVVGHSQITTTGIDRRDGFVETIKSDYPDVNIVDIQYGEGDHLESADIAKTMIAAHPDLKGIFATNEGSAIGVVNGVKELGMKPGDITIVGFDSGAAQIEAIKSGLMAGAITQDPIGMGAQVVQSAYDVATGKTVDDFTDTGSYWYDSTNIDDPKIAALLYQ
ncbi:ABC transporter substrate-binding protein [Isoptericola sp. b441]|uniref:ABC transporter substrate-binding protein n=1 Tax=Actinotalea lenta TaxID=3064654 RepID=A0ABT9DAD6_9CELL|nr:MULTISPECIES: ABC transporter substrate-binding protein [unclassified Isoptericola]MDO8106153.1 ABC transporter substrate-binding protein [Isoptericola sp. b441]MDO8122128.1 ABC transporter substrate-binding protein [Isoptericola sp. b490]